ncbi:MAG: dTMP kinase [Rhodospirillales bacterium]
MFIAVDGIDGSGKTTLVKNLRDHFASQNPVITKEPTDNSQWGQKMRIAAAEGRLSREIELEYFHKDRLEHIATVILPAINQGRIVITDRYVDSMLAYQANTPEEANVLYENVVEEILIPDITFILVCSVEIGLERIRKREADKGLSHFENDNALKRAAAIYESRKGDHYAFCDASGTSENTLRQALETLKQRFFKKPTDRLMVNSGVYTSE